MKIVETIGKLTFEDWKNKKVVLKGESRINNLEENIPRVNYEDFTEVGINEIKQEKEKIFISESDRKLDVLLNHYDKRRNNWELNLIKFNLRELEKIDDYLFGDVPHSKVIQGGLYSTFNQRQAQIFTSKNYQNNFEGITFDFVSVDYCQNDFCMEAFVFALWGLRTKVIKEMERKLQSSDSIFTNWEASLLFNLVKDSFEAKGELKKADYDYLFYKMKEVGAIKKSTTRLEYASIILAISPDLGFQLYDFKNRLDSMRREEIFNKVYDNSTFKLSKSEGLTIYRRV